MTLLTPKVRLLPFLIAAQALVLAVTSASALTVPANSPDIRYSGRIDDSNPEAVKLSYSGASIRMAFEGDSVALLMDNQRRQNWVTVFIDGKRTDKLAIKGEGGTYPLASGLGAGPHTVEVVKATEGMIGNVVFKGFVLPDDGKPLPWPAPQTRRIEFIGDSITCGYGIEADGPNNPFTPDEENFSDTYAALTARALDADTLVVARSGIGMLRNYNGPDDGSPDNIPAIYGRTLFHEPSPPWDFSRFTPDVVCINLCTNDFSSKTINVEKFEANYVQFVQRLEKQYPKAKIVVLQGPMNVDPKVRAILEGIVQSCNADGGDRVSFFQMSGQGAHGFGAHHHPSREQAQVNAQELTAYLRKLMGWEASEQGT